MLMKTSQVGRRFLAPVALSLMAAWLLLGSAGNSLQKVTAGSWQDRDDDQPSLEVGRVSLVAGQVGHRHSNDSPDEWFDATINLVIAEGDQICTGEDGRIEIQTDHGRTVRISRNSYLQFVSLSPASSRVSLMSGTASFQLVSVDSGGSARNKAEPTAESGSEGLVFEVNTPAVAITFRQPGNYRINVNDDGGAEVIVREGKAEVYRKEIGNIIVQEGSRFVIDGIDTTRFAVQHAEEADEWDRWNGRRGTETGFRAEENVRRGSGFVPESTPGFSDLDRYGQWQDTSEYGRIWSPSGVAASWAPYRVGYWRWYPTFGWTWISHEPWGWLPYHYGRWTWHLSRWCWVPIGRSPVLGRPAFVGRWAPHQVAFFGWGDNRYINGYRTGFADGYWSGFRDGRGWIGWSPLAPGEVRDNQRGTNGQSPVNYRSPGGASLLEGRRFIENRIVRITESLTTPPRTRGGVATEVARPVREQDLRPSRSSATDRSSLIQQPHFNARITSTRTLVVRERHLSPLRGGSVPVDFNARRPIIERGFLVRPATAAESNQRTPAESTTRGNVRPERSNIDLPRQNSGEVDNYRDSRPRRAPIRTDSTILSRPPISGSRIETPRREAPVPPVRTSREVPPNRPSPPVPPRATPSTGDGSPSRPGRTVAPERGAERPSSPLPRRDPPPR